MLGLGLPWRGGRVVECGGLEIRYGVKPIGGSNPPLSVQSFRICFKGV